MSHGIRVEDIAWQAFQAGAHGEGLALGDVGALEHARQKFHAWWALREGQGCDLPACDKCGHDPRARVTASWTFLVDRDPPSLNSRIFNAGPRRYLYKRERDAWCWELRAVRLLQRIPPARARRRITLTRVYSGRQQERDRDNLAGGMKAVVDAIVYERLLAGDDSKLAEIHYAQERGIPTGLRVLLEELS